MSVEQPPEELWPFAEYVAAKGHPATNGLGHKEATLEGVHGVLVPVTTRLRVTRRHDFVGKLSTKMDDSSTPQLAENQLGQKMLDIRNSFFQNVATGVSLDALALRESKDPASSPAKGASSEGGASSSQGPGSSTVGLAGLGGFQFQVAVPQLAQPPAPPAPGTEESKATPVKRRVTTKSPAARQEMLSRSPQEEPSAPGQQQAKPSPQGGASAGAKPSVRGRPPRDLAKIGKEECDRLRDADPSTALFFGDGWKTQNRHLQKLAKDMEAKLKGMDHSDSGYSAMQEIAKQVHAAHKVVLSYHQDGAHSKEFGKVWSEMENFCSLSPPVPFGMPAFLKCLRHESLVSDVVEASEFWKLVSKRELTQNHFMDIEETQEKLVSERRGHHEVHRQERVGVVAVLLPL